MAECRFSNGVHGKHYRRYREGEHREAGGKDRKGLRGSSANDGQRPHGDGESKVGGAPE